MQTERSPPTSAFERELSGYLACLKLPGGHGRHAAQLCRAHDFSAARAHLIVSRPGRWSGACERALVCSCPHRSLCDCLSRAGAGMQGCFVEAYNQCEPSSCGAYEELCLIYLLLWLMNGCMHAGAKLHAYGHLAVRRVLSQERFPDGFAGAPMVAQSSSLGSFDEEWLREFRFSLAAGLTTFGVSPRNALHVV